MKNETINLYTYEEWNSLKEEKEIARLERAAYFMKQRIFACGMFVFGILMLIMDHKFDMPGLSGCGVFIVIPLAIFVFFTKQMVLTNEYSLRYNEEER